MGHSSRSIASKRQCIRMHGCETIFFRFEEVFWLVVCGTRRLGAGTHTKNILIYFHRIQTIQRIVQT